MRPSSWRGGSELAILGSMRKVGVLLCGCGVYDGSEVQETVFLLLALQRRGLRPVALAPDVEQQDVVDHTSGATAEAPGPRRVLLESARLTRGVIRTLREVLPAELDALVIPGGMGAVKNLCLAGEGALGIGPVRPEVAIFLRELRMKGAPVALLGLARVVMDRLDGVPLEAGPMSVGPKEVVTDDERGWLFTPGFMASDSMTEVAEGIDRLVDELARRVGARRRPLLEIRSGSS